MELTVAGSARGQRGRGFGQPGEPVGRQQGQPLPAFIDGYHSGLVVTISLLAAGALVSYAALRLPRLAPAPARVPDYVPAGEDESAAPVSSR